MYHGNHSRSPRAAHVGERHGATRNRCGWPGDAGGRCASGEPAMAQPVSAGEGREHSLRRALLTTALTTLVVCLALSSREDPARLHARLVRIRGGGKKPARTTPVLHGSKSASSAQCPPHATAGAGGRNPRRTRNAVSAPSRRIARCCALLLRWSSRPRGAVPPVDHGPSRTGGPGGLGGCSEVARPAAGTDPPGSSVRVLLLASRSGCRVPVPGAPGSGHGAVGGYALSTWRQPSPTRNFRR